MVVKVSRVERPEVAPRQDEALIGLADDFFDPTFLTTLQAEIGVASFTRLLNTCLEDVEARLERLGEEGGRGDAKAARATAHQLLGIFGHVGATGGVNAARAILHATDDDDAMTLIPALLDAGSRSAMALRAISNRQSA